MLMSCVSVNRVPQSLTDLQDKPFLETPSSCFDRFAGQAISGDTILVVLDGGRPAVLGRPESGHRQLPHCVTVLGVLRRSQQVLHPSPNGTGKYYPWRVTASSSSFT